MTGRQFVVELERNGFVVRRRCRSFVWIARGEQVLMLDEEAAIPEGFLQRVLATSIRPPATKHRSSKPPHSQSSRRAPPLSTRRPSMPPSRTSRRPPST